MRTDRRRVFAEELLKRSQRIMTAFWFHCVGMPFRNSTPADLDSAESIHLEPEPSNVHDPEAIKVLIKTHGTDVKKHVGYVKRDETLRVKPFLTSPYTVTMLEAYPRSALLVLDIL